MVMSIPAFPRRLAPEVRRSLDNFPVVALTGPRQCGKTTLARSLLAGHDNALYLDLERPSDLRKLADPEWFLSSQKDKLVCIDEIQRHPDLFPVLRSLVDEWGTPGHFLVLGSASRDLLRQSSESLAGRIVYKRLTPFLPNELPPECPLETFLNRGGFPRSLMAADEAASLEWRESFIATFLERDLPQWAGFSGATMSRLWRMLAHHNGQTINLTEFAATLGVSAPSVRHYIDLLASTYMLEIVLPYRSNLGKRLVKSPRIYIADSGLTHALLGIRNFPEAMGHPGLGAVWEQCVLATLIGNFPDADIAFYRTSQRAEIDFVLTLRGLVFAVECKASLSPALSRGNHNAIEDIAPARTFVVTPGKDAWSLACDIHCVSLPQLVEGIAEML
ncbi:MAG: ATP-binding protein [Zoogloeaceae bacterium]|nr:ATP-binding protein [Zoogloeaceae bacterium]